MRGRFLYAALLTSVGCNCNEDEPVEPAELPELPDYEPRKEAPFHDVEPASTRNVEAAWTRKTDDSGRPAPPSAELGRAGDELHAASSYGTWVALCRDGAGVLVLREGRELPFHTLVDYDENGRWVVVASQDRAQLVDAWSQTTSPLPGRGHDLDRAGARLSYWLEHDTPTPVVVRELATGEERGFGEETPSADRHHTIGFMDFSGRFLFLDAAIDSREARFERGTCDPHIHSPHSTRGRRIWWPGTELIALDLWGTPRYVLPADTNIVRETLDGWPLFTVEEPFRIQRWTLLGIETLTEAADWLDPHNVRDPAFVFLSPTPGDYHAVKRYAGDQAQEVGPSGQRSNAPAPDSEPYAPPIGVVPIRNYRWLHVATGGVVRYDASAGNAYADATRMVWLDDGVALIIDPMTGEVLHHHQHVGRPSLALGSWVAMRADEETFVLDLQRPSWLGHAPPLAVALAETGHVLIATEKAWRPTGPFRWVMALATTDGAR